jgi:hypothetical protein
LLMRSLRRSSLGSFKSRTEATSSRLRYVTPGSLIEWPWKLHKPRVVRIVQASYASPFHTQLGCPLLGVPNTKCPHEHSSALCNDRTPAHNLANQAVKNPNNWVIGHSAHPCELCHCRLDVLITANTHFQHKIPTTHHHQTLWPGG